MEGYQCSARANSLQGAQAVDDFDGHDVGGPDRFLSLGHVAVDDLIEMEELPQPETQPHIAEAASIRPAHRVEADLHDIEIIGDGDQGLRTRFLGVFGQYS